MVSHSVNLSSLPFSLPFTSTAFDGRKVPQELRQHSHINIRLNRISNQR
ncbi:unnamed protein product [Anisakis simplex]|uniref:Uncharacterized protein n=1 Tax=Anisakis simplex TaxID=6269 RepID=A0A3P6RL84_ANISI|nr:unnamed protein product [Anisakis simplex]